MNDYIGSVLELKGKKAIIMSDSCDFVTIQRQSQMYVGQQIKFKKSDISKTNKTHLKYFALVASVFMIALCSIFYIQIFLSSAVFAYVDVDINPSVEFSIDKNSKVLVIKPLNSDAEKLLKDLQLEDLPIKEAISLVVETAKNLGYINTSKTNEVLISASINIDNKAPISSDQKTYDNILNDIGSISFKVGTDTLNPQILTVTPDNRKSAIKNNLSMGRYALYLKIKEDNKDITVENAKTVRISDMFNKAKIKKTEKQLSDKAESQSSKSTIVPSKATGSKNNDNEINNKKNAAANNANSNKNHNTDSSIKIHRDNVHNNNNSHNNSHNNSADKNTTDTNSNNNSPNKKSTTDTDSKNNNTSSNKSTIDTNSNKNNDPKNSTHKKSDSKNNDSKDTSADNNRKPNKNK